MSEATANTTKPTAPKPHKNHPDAELFRLCEQAGAVHDKMLDFFKGGKYYIADDDARAKQLEPLSEALYKLVSSINRIHAHTIEGIQARAKLALRIDHDISDLTEETYFNISLPAAITRDLANIDLSKVQS